MTMELIYYDPYLTTPGNKNSYSEQESNMVCYFGHLTVSKGWHAVHFCRLAKIIDHATFFPVSSQN
jgi:hypothetical protein